MLKRDKREIGILGGSFDPPHEGHVEISKISLKKIKLSKIFWVITKKNPFKKKPFFSLKDRVSKSKKSIKKYKNIKVIYLEDKIKSSRTIDVINYFRRVKKQTQINRIRKSKYKNAVKHMELLLKSKEADKAKKYFSKFQSILMQVAKSGSISKKTAARKISKISKKI